MIPKRCAHQYYKKNLNQVHNKLFMKTSSRISVTSLVLKFRLQALKWQLWQPIIHFTEQFIDVLYTDILLSFHRCQSNKKVCRYDMKQTFLSYQGDSYSRAVKFPSIIWDVN